MVPYSVTKYPHKSSLFRREIISKLPWAGGCQLLWVVRVYTCSVAGMPGIHYQTKNNMGLYSIFPEYKFYWPSENVLAKR